MAQGTDFSGNKNGLLTDGIEKNVFKNGKGFIDGDKNQESLKNLAETFWGPEDGKQYARKNGVWDEVSSGNQSYNNIELDDTFNNTTYNANSFEKIYANMSGIGTVIVDLPNDGVNDFDRIIVMSHGGAITVNVNTVYLDKLYTGDSVVYEYNASESEWRVLSGDRISVRTLEAEVITGLTNATLDVRKAYSFKSDSGSNTTITLINGAPNSTHVGKWAIFHRQNPGGNGTLNVTISLGIKPFGLSLTNIAVNSFVSFEIVEFIDPENSTIVYYPINISRTDTL